ncbi:CvpA family protein [Gluconacetobacter sacchari]|uniref:CvpA family protein n=2 Tax=Gluconacetobacter sacchari TaxID=92759 RepID=A0A7W4IAR2_9PROT|nr:CvpA family protein [Gluconacetobacter sacchari]MBB2159426.1 CvpA family protein [Gluconacetobacter sacchari]GBQ27584.1 colicin V production protein [Gluconacetobacter sacchari DSM 12717]
MSGAWVDLAASLVVAASALFGWGRGLVRELLGLATWAGALVLAVRWQEPVRQALAPWIDNPTVASAAAFVLPCIGLLIVFTLSAQLIGRIVRDSALGGLNGLLGLLFGGLRGYVLLAALYLAVAAEVAPADWPPPVQQARATPLVARGAFLLGTFLPISMQARLAQPVQTGHDAPI